MKKNTKIIIGIITFLAIIFLGSLSTYYFLLTAPSSDNEDVTFIIEPGTSTIKIIENLKEEKLIRSDLALKVYTKLNKNSLQAGTYVFKRSMDATEIIQMIADGSVTIDAISIRFIEGKRLRSYVKSISEAFKIDDNEIIDVINDPKYLNELIGKHWFLTNEILNDNIYFPLEGYLFPDTYLFERNSSIEEIIEKLLINTGLKLEAYRKMIEASEYTVHEILSMAAIIELEANNEDDRQSVSQVISKRLDVGMSLGMDVTTYYAVQKEMGEVLLRTDLSIVNAYNTRDDANMAGKLPVGPICNSSIISIDAVFNPSDTDYLYFFADITTGEVYFAEDHDEFLQIIRKVG